MNYKPISFCAFATLFCALIFNACSPVSEQHNVLSDQEKSEGWTLLFDGKTTNGWHLFNKGDSASVWMADSGQLICNPHAKNVKHGDLITDKEYKNYDLQFEWKISKGGNSGLFIDVQERPELGATFVTGPEYQLLDEKNAEPGYIKSPAQRAAAIFGVVANNSKSIPKAGDWNQSRILKKGSMITFWLNGVQTISVDRKSDQWKKGVAGSYMNNFPTFGVALKGHIAVQDWTSGVSFRDIKIKEL
jgi:hypothetical protein